MGEPFLNFLSKIIVSTSTTYSNPASPQLLNLGSNNFKAPVTIDGDTLFFLRGSSALPAPERAKQVQDLNIRVAESSDSLSVENRFEKTYLAQVGISFAKISE